MASLQERAFTRHKSKHYHLPIPADRLCYVSDGSQVLRTMKRKPQPGLPMLFDSPKYRQRNIIERMFGWQKENRRIGTRYDKLAKIFGAIASLARTMRCLRHYFSYTT